ncbi:MAG: glutathione peroxidase [Verrucomicrobiales bacterium]|nr:glutathione peroxidase [Verrucomicrobiales bacterium]
MLAIAGALAVSVCLADAVKNVAEIPLKDIDGKETSLKAQKAKVMLVVNVASRCGLTPQYDALEKLQKKYKSQGFSVVAFPCNDFGAQEPGTPAQIKEFCKSTYDVSFPLMEKVHVKGQEQHPLYAALTGKEAAFPGDIEWNFGKFLVTADGKVLKRFNPRKSPDDPEVVGAIEAALAAK